MLRGKIEASITVTVSNHFWLIWKLRGDKYSPEQTKIWRHFNASCLYCLCVGYLYRRLKKSDMYEIWNLKMKLKCIQCYISLTRVFTTTFSYSYKSCVVWTSEDFNKNSNYNILLYKWIVFSAANASQFYVFKKKKVLSVTWWTLQKWRDPHLLYGSKPEKSYSSSTEKETKMFQNSHNYRCDKWITSWKIISVMFCLSTAKREWTTSDSNKL